MWINSRTKVLVFFTGSWFTVGMGTRKRILTRAAACIAAAATLTTLASSDTSARHVYGEFAVRNGNIPNIEQPARMDVEMYRGYLDGQSYWTRCENRGGYIRFEQWATRTATVCIGVDY